MTAAPGPEVAVYVISVAAELSGLHPQTLRAYERMGLITPGRTLGGGRRYSRTRSRRSSSATPSWWPSSRRPVMRCGCR